MFIDSVEIVLSSGDGGKGAVSFRREKYVPLGGPDGGDGGKGGDVIIICDNNAHTLANFKGKKKLAAQNGADGEKKNKSGKSGANLEIPVPQGTQIIDTQSKEVLADMTKEGQRELLLKGASVLEFANFGGLFLPPFPLPFSASFSSPFLSTPFSLPF